MGKLAGGEFPTEIHTKVKTTVDGVHVTWTQNASQKAVVEK